MLPNLAGIFPRVTIERPFDLLLQYLFLGNFYVSQRRALLVCLHVFIKLGLLPWVSIFDPRSTQTLVSFFTSINIEASCLTAT